MVASYDRSNTLLNLYMVSKNTRGWQYGIWDKKITAYQGHNNRSGEVGALIAAYQGHNNRSGKRRPL